MWFTQNKSQPASPFIELGELVCVCVFFLGVCHAHKRVVFARIRTYVLDWVCVCVWILAQGCCLCGVGDVVGCSANKWIVSY